MGSRARTAANFLAAQRPHDARKATRGTQTLEDALGHPKLVHTCWEFGRDSREGAARPAQKSISRVGKGLAWSTKLGGTESGAQIKTGQMVLSVYKSKLLLLHTEITTISRPICTARICLCSITQHETTPSRGCYREGLPVRRTHDSCGILVFVFVRVENIGEFQQSSCMASHVKRDSLASVSVRPFTKRT